MLWQELLIHLLGLSVVHEHVDLSHQGLICLLVGGNFRAVGKALAFDDPGETGLLFTHLGDWRCSFSTVHLEHGPKIGEARGEPAFLDGVDLVCVCDWLQGSSVADGMRLLVRHCGALIGLCMGFRVNLLEPRS